MRMFSIQKGDVVMQPTKTRVRSTLTKVLVLAATGASVTLLLANPAAAATDDSFGVSTTNACGAIDFVDFGPGAPGGGDNDDYVEIHDFCSDGHGVEGYAWLDGIYLGNTYNGNGLSGSAVVWDPFKAFGNVIPGDTVGIKVCLVDGPNDPSPSDCRSASHTSVDG
jgi:hypothetical protein